MYGHGEGAFECVLVLETLETVRQAGLQRNETDLDPHNRSHRAKAVYRVMSRHRLNLFGTPKQLGVCIGFYGRHRITAAQHPYCLVAVHHCCSFVRFVLR